ncbi:hypothetical protein MVEG_10388 [Podila verticillata NRRL 6337]|nr:hypothetical protein MVEG_10388 [Podila verticillata NRRL 6337]
MAHLDQQRRAPSNIRPSFVLILSLLVLCSLTTYTTASPIALTRQPSVQDKPLSSLSSSPIEAVTAHSQPKLTKRQDLSEQPLYDLIERLLPQAYHAHFVFQLQPGLVLSSATNIHDTFRISNSSDGDKILVQGATLSGLGAGLNYYLKYVCKVEMSWSGDRFSGTNGIPAVPPLITANVTTDPAGITRASFVPFRYYMNVVTFGYSSAFWDWERWERELDWMMLNGVNMALGMVGQEYVARRFYENLGLTREELNLFFGGPAFMPWQRMGNTQGSWGYENDTQFKNDWIDSQWELQQLIIERMKIFNITAILPSFNGFVPRQLPQKFPNSTFEVSSVWAGMPEQYTKVNFIPSTDPLFITLSQQFIELQTSMYNGYTSHYYLLDLYNELVPTCTRVDCLQATTAGVMKALKIADPQAVWVLQGWFLLHRDVWQPPQTKAFFDGIREVNNGRDAFVIDLYSDVAPLWRTSEGFFGIDWGWSMLNNFGGGQGLYGTLPTLITEPLEGYKHPAKSMRGIGITMEGINNNEYLYHLILDIPWYPVDPPTAPGAPAMLDGPTHLEEFMKRRYGPNQTSPAVLDAWKTLSQTVWDCKTGQMSQSKSFIDITPSLDMVREGFMTNKFWYDQKQVTSAWGQLVESTQTEASKKRRGHGVIQNMFDEVVRAAMGKTPTNDAPTSSRFAGHPGLEQDVKHKGSLAKSLSNVIRLTFLEILGQNKPIERVAPPVPTAQVSTLPEASNLPLDVSSFRYDLVDVTREVLTAIVLPGLHKEFVQAYKSKNLDQTRALGSLLIEVVDDTDKILSTHSHFMVGPWIRDARVSAKIAAASASAANVTKDIGAYSDYMEFNARNQITWWGPQGQQGLADYASKHWGGVVKEFYGPRWQIFVDRVVSAVQAGKPLDYEAYKADSLKVETQWQIETTCLGQGCALQLEGSNPRKVDKYSVDAMGDTIEVAQDLWDKWGRVAQRLASAA